MIRQNHACDHEYGWGCRPRMRPRIRAAVHECGHESGLPSTNAATNARIDRAIVSRCLGLIGYSPLRMLTTYTPFETIAPAVNEWGRVCRPRMRPRMHELCGSYSAAGSGCVLAKAVSTPFASMPPMSSNHLIATAAVGVAVHEYGHECVYEWGRGCRPRIRPRIRAAVHECGHECTNCAAPTLLRDLVACWRNVARPIAALDLHVMVSRAVWLRTSAPLRQSKPLPPMAPSTRGNRTAPSALRRESPPRRRGGRGGAPHRSAISETAMPWCAQANHLNDKGCCPRMGSGLPSTNGAGAAVHEYGHESGLPSTNAATNARIVRLLLCSGIWLRAGETLPDLSRPWISMSW